MERAQPGKDYLIIGDDAAFRQRLRQILANCLTEECLLADCGQAHAVAMAERMQPTLLLIDTPSLRLAGLLADLARAAPGARSLVFAPDWDDATTCQALLDGAYGCLPRTACQDSTLLALRIIEAGHYWAGATALGLAFARLRSLRPRRRTVASDWLAGLTARERMVAEVAMRGLDNKEIARELGISIATVKTHLHHVFGKLGTTRRGLLLRRRPASG